MPLSTNPDKIRLKLSMLWIFLVANYLYCDVLSLMDPAFQRALLQGGPPGLPMTESFLLYAGFLMEIPMAMIVASRLLEHSANRWLNLIAGFLMTLVQIGSFWMGTGPTLHYVFFSAVEIGTLLVIVFTAWHWKTSSDRGISDNSPIAQVQA
jgi:hypothetical protein